MACKDKEIEPPDDGTAESRTKHELVPHDEE